MEPDAKAAVVKMSVGAGGSLATALTLNEWVALATLAYLLLQIGLLIPKYWRLVADWFRSRT